MDASRQETLWATRDTEHVQKGVRRPWETGAQERQVVSPSLYFILFFGGGVQKAGVASVPKSYSFPAASRVSHWRKEAS